MKVLTVAGIYQVLEEKRREEKKIHGLEKLIL